MGRFVNVKEFHESSSFDISRWGLSNVHQVNDAEIGRTGLHRVSLHFNFYPWPLVSSHHSELVIRDPPLEDSYCHQAAIKQGQEKVRVCAGNRSFYSIPNSQAWVPRWLLIGADFYCSIAGMFLIVIARSFWIDRLYSVRLLGALSLFLSALLLPVIFALSHLVYSCSIDMKHEYHEGSKICRRIRSR